METPEAAARAGPAHGPTRVLTRTESGSAERAARRLPPEPRGKDTGENGAVRTEGSSEALKLRAAHSDRGPSQPPRSTTRRRGARCSPGAARGALTCRCVSRGSRAALPRPGRAPRDTRAANAGRSSRDTPMEAGLAGSRPGTGAGPFGAGRALPEAGPQQRLPGPRAGPGYGSDARGAGRGAARRARTAGPAAAAAQVTAPGAGRGAGVALPGPASCARRRRLGVGAGLSGRRGPAPRVGDTGSCVITESGDIRCAAAAAERLRTPGAAVWALLPRRRSGARGRVRGCCCGARKKGSPPVLPRLGSGGIAPG